MRLHLIQAAHSNPSHLMITTGLLKGQMSRTKHSRPPYAADAFATYCGTCQSIIIATAYYARTRNPGTPTRCGNYFWQRPCQVAGKPPHAL